MRGPPKSDDEEHSGPHKGPRKHLIKKHPNKHHEGDRKRWRDQITERERKRYEGVWAANRGTHVLFSDSDLQSLEKKGVYAGEDPAREYVSNLVVRDIWSRSRLPEDVLEEIWDLVDHEGAGRLTRDEFIVGMWLIDQRLKGRKLPIRVSESVWASVRRLRVKIHSMKR